MSTVVEMSQADYARYRGISAAAVQKAINVGRIPVAAVRRINRGKLIDVAAADLALGGSRMRLNTLAEPEVAEPRAAAPPAVVSETAGLTKARTQQAEYDARLKELEYRSRVGKVVGADDVRRSMLLCAEAVVRDLSQLAARADDLVTACTRGGVPAVRALLKEIERQIRGTLAENMRLLGKDEDGGDEVEVADEPGLVS